MKKSILILIIFTILSCSKVPITGRRQLSLIPESTLSQMSLSNYREFLTTHPPISPTLQNAAMVKRVGLNIARAVEMYLKSNNYISELNNLQWEFNLVEDPQVNAWCMPGGKVVVYSGLLPIAKDDAGLAVVMGHEIAHAVAKHGSERLSQQLAIQLGGISLAIALKDQPSTTNNLFNMAYGVGSQLGVLAYSRTHEYEADKLGMVFMAMAGYDPNRAAQFWEDMNMAGGGSRPLEFLSTHPAPENRIKAIREYAPKAMQYYNYSTINNSKTITTPIDKPSKVIKIKVN